MRAIRVKLDLLVGGTQRFGAEYGLFGSKWLNDIVIIICSPHYNQHYFIYLTEYRSCNRLKFHCIETTCVSFTLGVACIQSGTQSAYTSSNSHQHDTHVARKLLT